MRQIFQDLKNGATRLDTIPPPALRPGHVQVRTAFTLISSGTERMLVEFGRAGWLDKARQQPERVHQVLDKVRTDGLLATWDAVSTKLETPLPLGYCHAGIVTGVGDGVDHVAVGDRVATNGPHAERVCVPKHLCVPLPDPVSLEDAAFVPAAAIALQGIRLMEPTLGETVVVSGLGLIGILAGQLLKAQGCGVIGFDPSPDRCRVAAEAGIVGHALSPESDPLATVLALTRHRGADAVLITAATESNAPIEQAAAVCRKRGRVVLTGVVGLNLPRTPFYEKEIRFQVSCSYGPGRYDPAYEAGGQDYPPPYVRWTAQRNFEAVLDLMASGALQVAPLITHRFALDQAAQAYDTLLSEPQALGILLTYPQADVPAAPETDAPLPLTAAPRTAGMPAVPVIGAIGAGNYAGRILLPCFADQKVRLRTIVSRGGASAAALGNRLGFEQVATDPQAVLDDEAINTVVLATRHDSHADLAERSVRAGKHTFLEKPLALTADEIAALAAGVQAARSPGTGPVFTVGYNRRFAPLVLRMRALLAEVSAPRAFVYTVNAGALPADHWLQDPAVGGGRLIGEACHFIDLLRHLAGAPIVEAKAQALREPESPLAVPDTLSITLSFADGHLGTIHYFANGAPAVPKERLEVFTGGRVLQLDNFRVLRGSGWRRFRSHRLWRQDKGQSACVAAFLNAVRHGGGDPIPLPELVEAAETAVALSQSLHS